VARVAAPPAPAFKPGDIPVERTTKFDLVVNLTTAKALGLTIPESFLLRATEVID
jgi:putative ABC transport system substrate-binding protein